MALYETVAEPLDEAAREAALAADYVTFTSSSTVRFFLEALDGGLALRPPPGLDRPGDQRDALREHGLEPDVEAARHDVDGLVEALVADAAGGD